MEPLQNSPVSRTPAKQASLQEIAEYGALTALILFLIWAAYFSSVAYTINHGDLGLGGIVLLLALGASLLSFVLGILYLLRKKYALGVVLIVASWVGPPGQVVGMLSCFWAIQKDARSSLTISPIRTSDRNRRILQIREPTFHQKKRTTEVVLFFWWTRLEGVRRKLQESYRSCADSGTQDAKTLDSSLAPSSSTQRRRS